MKQFYLHIGLPRTGTSFLQNEVFKKLPIHYKHDMLTVDEFGLRDGINLLSHEDLCGKIYLPTKLDRLGFFSYYSKYKPKIIMGIREQESLHKSMYNILLWLGYSKSFQDAKKHLEYKYNVDEIVNQVHTYFDDVFIYHFDDFKKNNEKVVSDICDFLNVDIPNVNFHVVNKRWNKRQMWLCRNINKVISQKIRCGVYSTKRLLYCINK